MCKFGVRIDLSRAKARVEYPLQLCFSHRSDLRCTGRPCSNVPYLASPSEDINLK